MYLFDLSPIRFLSALLFIFSATAASASEPAHTTARTMEIHIENGEQSLDASKQTSTMNLDGANLTSTCPTDLPVIVVTVKTRLYERRCPLNNSTVSGHSLNHRHFGVPSKRTSH